MNTLEQSKLVKIALTKMLDAYAKYEGKNLNRYKNVPEIDKLREDFENNPPPFEFNGTFSCVIIDHQNVNLTRLKEKISEIDSIIEDVKIFNGDYKDQYSRIEKDIRSLVEQRTKIQREFKNIPSYMFKDLL